MAAPPLDEHGRIAGDLACPRCEHNLRGLTLRDKCAECGYDVRHAIRFQRYRATWTPGQKVAVWAAPFLAAIVLIWNVRDYSSAPPGFMGVVTEYASAGLFACLWLVMAAAVAVVLGWFMWNGRFRLSSVAVLAGVALACLVAGMANGLYWLTG